MEPSNPLAAEVSHDAFEAVAAAWKALYHGDLITAGGIALRLADDAGDGDLSPELRALVDSIIEAENRALLSAAGAAAAA